MTQVSSPSNLYHRAHLYYFAAAPLLALAERAGLLPVMVDGSRFQANLTAIFSKPPSGAAVTARHIESAYDEVVAANRRRTLGRYLLAGNTISNVLPRLLVRVAERRIEREGTSARALLDRLFGEEGLRLSSPGA